ncbi:MAG: TonB-dependent receptor [Bacteroidetes bacterium]|nr:MAG: TonB-dependent receptor [Bacteroidota bacterium]
MIKYLFLLITISCFPFLYAQQISGDVYDNEGNPLEYVKVKVLSIDSAVVSGAFTDINGHFEIAGVQPGNYILQLSLPPFKIIERNVELKNVINLGKIAMEMDNTLELEGVVAKGSRDVLKAGIDKKIYSTQDDLTSKGGTVQDILNNIPSIEVDQDGNISLRGDGNVIILIDGRPSALAMGDGKNLLSALPANSIERIEVVTNPSAKYDPDGTSGIINIVMKKNRLKGFNGMISATAATGGQYEGNFALSYRNSKLNLYGNYSYNHREGYRNYDNDLIRNEGATDQVTLSQERSGTDLEEGHTAVIGLDYYINKSNSLGISGTLAPGLRQRTGDLFTTQIDAAGDTLDYWNRRSEDPEKNLNFDLSFNFQHKFKEDKGDWMFSANHSVGEEDFQASYEQDDYWLSGVQLSQPTVLQRLFNNEKTTTSTFQLDITRLFPKIGARSEFGAKSIVRDQLVSPYSDRFDYVSQTYVSDTLANYDYAFHFEVHSIYGIFGQELGKFKYQGGIRGEYAVQAPDLISSGESYFTTYVNLFPSAHLKYAVSENGELSLSYSRRINRPGAGQLNPFTSYADPFNLRSGNPFLQPEYINSYDLGYSMNKKKLNFSFSVFHRQTTDVINRVKLFNPDNSAFVTFANIDKSISTGLETVIIWKPVKWLKNTFSLNGNYVEYINNDPLTNWNNSGLIWSAKNALVVDFWKETATVQLNVQYNAPRPTPQGIVQRRGGVDLSVSKSFMKKKLNFTVRTTDIFDRVGFIIDFDRDGINQDSHYKWLTRRLWFTASYTFGNFEKKMRTNGGGGGGDGE